MKTTTFISHHRWWATALVGLSLFCLFVMSACGPTATPTPVVTPIPPTATLVLPTEAPVTIASIAEDITADLGQIVTIVEGSPDQIIIVFEETHVSPAGQIQIAIMLNRLYETYDLRHIRLEGAIAADGVLDASWFHHPPPFSAGDRIRDREDAIVQLLEDGEISSAEMMALIYADAEVAGIEKKEEYDVELPEGAASATIIYLYKIAVPGLTQSEISKANDLSNQDKILEAVEFIISTDEFTEEMYARLNDPNVMLSVEKLVEIIDEIEAKTAEVEADITPEDKADLEALRTFYQTASLRGHTMVTNVLALVEKSSGVPVAITIGAAHSEVSDLFADAGVSFAVIRPNSLAENREEGDLSFKAYDRKLLQLSVDPPGSLGPLLDGRRKPRPVIGEVWLKSKAEMYLLITRIARAFAQGQLPPFEEALSDVLPGLRNVTLIPDTIQVDGNDVIFSVQVLNNNSQPVQIWVRTKVDKAIAEKTLKERLFEALSNVQDKESPDLHEAELTESEPILTRVSSDTIAKVSTDQAAIVNTTLGG